MPVSGVELGRILCENPDTSHDKGETVAGRQDLSLLGNAAFVNDESVNGNMAYFLGDLPMKSGGYRPTYVFGMASGQLLYVRMPGSRRVRVNDLTKISRKIPRNIERTIRSKPICAKRFRETSAIVYTDVSWATHRKCLAVRVSAARQRRR